MSDNLNVGLPSKRDCPHCHGIHIGEPSLQTAYECIVRQWAKKTNELYDAKERIKVLESANQQLRQALESREFSMSYVGKCQQCGDTVPIENGVFTKSCKCEVDYHFVKPSVVIKQSP